MADDSINQDLGKEKSQASNDDDFDSTYFEFDELEDDGDEVDYSDEPTSLDVPIVEDSDKEMSSIDAGNLDQKISETNTEDLSMEQGGITEDEDLGEIVDDGLLFEEESFEEFDSTGVTSETSEITEVDEEYNLGEGRADESEGHDSLGESTSDMDLSTALDNSGLDMDFGDDLEDSELDLGGNSSEALDSDGDDLGLETGFVDDLADSFMFDDAETPDVEFVDGEEGVPFGQQVEGAEGLPESEFNHDDPTIKENEEEVVGARSKFIKIVIVGTIIFVAIGFGFLYLNGSMPFVNGSMPFGENKDEPKKVVKTEKVKTEEKKPAKKATNTNTKKKTTTKTQVKKPAISTAGFTMLSAKTGQQYFIVASFGSSQAAQTYATRLVVQGQSPSIIPPFGSAKNHRVAVISFATLSEAKRNIESYRQKFEKNAWILKY